MEHPESEQQEGQRDAEGSPQAPTPIGAADAGMAAPKKSRAGFASKIAALYGTDAELEEHGAWMDVAEGIRWRIRSQGSRIARAADKRLDEPYAALFAAGTPLTPEQEDERQTAWLAGVLVTDWEGMDDDEGASIACTDLHVAEILTRWPYLRRKAWEFSMLLRNYQPPAAVAGTN